MEAGEVTAERSWRCKCYKRAALLLEPHLHGRGGLADALLQQLGSDGRKVLGDLDVGAAKALLDVAGGGVDHLREWGGVGVAESCQCWVRKRWCER